MGVEIGIEVKNTRGNCSLEINPSVLYAAGAEASSGQEPSYAHYRICRQSCPGGREGGTSSATLTLPSIPFIISVGFYLILQLCLRLSSPLTL